MPFEVSNPAASFPLQLLHLTTINRYRGLFSSSVLCIRYSLQRATFITVPISSIHADHSTTSSISLSNMATNTSSQTSTATTTFPRYPELPTELQRQIWEETFEPRIITLHTQLKHHHMGPDSDGFFYQVPCEIPTKISHARSLALAAASLTIYEEPQPIRALAVCPFSRGIALAGRYRAWYVIVITKQLP